VLLRDSKIITVTDIAALKTRLLLWAQQFEQIVWLDSNTEFQISKQNYSSYDAILAVGTEKKLECSGKQSFQKLKSFQETTNDYIFGYLGYDLKNDTEKLQSNNFDGLNFSDLYFFQPKKLFLLKDNQLIISYLKSYVNELENDLQSILHFESDNQLKTDNLEKLKIQSRITETEYQNKLQIILEHIHHGDIYEVNLCQEFFAENTRINPIKVFQKLNDISSPPFAVFLKIKEHYALSASPERFVKRMGNRVISQPVKGTARRLKNVAEDQKIAKKLATDPKERAENIMIVDLVRNDLSKTAKKGTVQVEELCQVYTFKQVHQLISTVISEVKDKTNSIDLLQSLFPMGSMTGAPKISAMQIIETQEETKRSLYSGAIGYCTPNNDFDFNVVIRSILFNAKNNYVSFSVGSAITAQSIIEKEYEECLIKAEAMKKALQ
jgi:para-aminobenzoate synthetase component 1